MNNFSGAFNDAQLALKIEPKNHAIIAYLQHLTVLIQQKQKEANSLESRVNQMMSLCFEYQENSEKRLQAINNLIVLVREKAAAELVFEKDGAQQLLKVVSTDNDPEMVIAGLRVFVEFMNHDKLVSHLYVYSLRLSPS
ncbi:unnamed protein product [Soboliphyme baturini]|uniref:TPR_REGION domain-containing protein n=1 Tax=Soboliphyme baturini TaxID=241478 RepID=A0A183JAR4_9BILA|nr:unnamed protein product [Soboliphyme baturini]